jgi:hypothetical protein
LTRRSTGCPSILARPAPCSSGHADQVA